MTITDAVLPGEEVGRLTNRLRPRLHGRLHLPGDPDWDQARQAWQLLADQHPLAVVEAADVHDIVETVQAAREAGLAVAPQGTGHGAGSVASLDGAVLLRTGRLDAISIDPGAQTATIGAGAVWGDVAAAAAEHGLAAVAGMAGTVGAAGLLLGGGVGWFARSHGLASRGILALDAVDAHGHVLRIDEDENPDLLWTARGGALPVIVTSLTIRLHRVPQLVAGALMWPTEQVADVARAWQTWIGGLPETVTSLLRILRFPPIPPVPEPLRGREFVAIEAALQLEPEEAERMLSPLRAREPELDSFRPMSPAELATVHGDPPMPVPAHGDGALLRDIDADVIAAFTDAVQSPSARALLSIELRHLGGRVTAPTGDGDERAAVSALEGRGLLHMVGIVPSPEVLDAVRAGAETVMARMAPFASHRQVKTFAERPASAAALYGEAAERVRRIAAEWDPDGVIRLGHPLP